MDEDFLRRAIALALANVEKGDGGGPFGAVIVRDGVIVAEGVNRVVPDNDPTAHAEMLAIRAACQKLGRFHLADCTLYASSEPCPMCLSAACWARIARIVFANPRSVAAAIGFCDAALYRELALPCAQRQLPTEHLTLPDADAPLRRWQLVPGHIPY